MRIPKNLKKQKISLFPKNVVQFGLFLEMKWNVKGVNKILVSDRLFQYKNARKTSFKKYYTISSISITTKANRRRKSLMCSP